MVSLLVHAALGVVVIGWIVSSNPKVFTRPAGGSWFSLPECVYYVVGIASIALGWYFNIRFVQQYAHGAANPLWGPGSWAEYVRLMFTNPAASSAGQDYTIANVILLPLFSTTDGYRRGLRRPWLYFVSSLFTKKRWPISSCPGRCSTSNSAPGRWRSAPVMGRHSWPWPRTLVSHRPAVFRYSALICRKTATTGWPQPR